MLFDRIVSPVFAGRESELTGLVRALDQLPAGRGATVLIGGDVGIGKSRLCQELKREATAHGIRVIEGRCTPAEDRVPYGPFMDALRFRLARGEAASIGRILGPLTSFLTPLFPELSELESAAPGPVPEPASRRPFEMLGHAFRRLAESGPVLLVLEDLHWADPTSCDLLEYISRHIGDSPLLVVATYRSDELHDGHPMRRLRATLVRERLAVEIALAPLTRSDVRTMIAAILGTTADDRFVDAVWERTEGNPLFVEELLKSAAEQGQPDAAALDPVQLTRAAPPSSVAEMVRWRVDALGQPARDVLSVAAVIGRHFSFELLQVVTGMPEEELLAVVEQCLARRLLVEVPGVRGRGYVDEQFSFRHALTQEVLYNDLLARRRRQWHARVATAIEGETPDGPRPTSYAALAYHARLGGDGVRARRYAVLAGDQAMGLHAWRDAEEHYRAALETADGPAPGPAQRAELLEKLSEVAWWQSRTDDAQRRAEEALGLWRTLGDRRRTAALLRRLGGFYGHQRGDWDRALGSLQEALALVTSAASGGTDAEDAAGVAYDVVERTRAANDLALLSLARGDHEAAEAWLGRAGEHASDCGDPAEEAFTLVMRGHLAVMRAQVGAGVRLIDEAHGLLGDRTLPLERESAVRITGIRALITAHEHARAVAWIEAGHAHQHAARAESAVYRVYRAAIDRHLGEWERALTTAVDAVDELRATGRSELRHGLTVLGDVHRVRGDFESAYRAYDEAIALGDRAAEIGRALTQLAEGHAGDAAAALSRALEALPSANRLFTLRALSALVEARVRAERLDDAEDALGHLALDAETADDRVTRIALSHATGLTCAAEGRTDVAVGALTAAAAGWQELGEPFEHARASLDLAAVLLESDAQRERGMLVARQALATLEKLGARPDAARARRLLRRPEIDGRRAPRAHARRSGEDVRSTGSPAGLTARERSVLVEVAKGRTNKEIARVLGIRDKTVAVHVGHILAKLRCATRTEAARYAITSGLAGGEPRPGHLGAQLAEKDRARPEGPATHS